MSVCQQSLVKVTSSVLWQVRVCSAGTTYFRKKNYFKAMFSFHWIRVLITVYCYSLHIFSQYHFFMQHGMREDF